MQLSDYHLQHRYYFDMYARCASANNTNLLPSFWF